MSVSRLLPALLLTVLATPVTAASITTSLSEGPVPEVTKSSDVDFLQSNCEEECDIATLSCDENRSVGFTYADVDSKDVAKALLGKQEIRLVVGKKSFSFSIDKLQFVEMTGTWWMDTHLFDDRLELLPALAAAKEFKVTRPGGSLTLPVTPEVLTWAKACKGND